jgi:hypothetical protein
MRTVGTHLVKLRSSWSYIAPEIRLTVVTKLSRTRSSALCAHVSLATWDTGRHRSCWQGILNTFRCTWSILKSKYFFSRISPPKRYSFVDIGRQDTTWSPTTLSPLTLLAVRGIFVKIRTSPCLLVRPYSFVQCTFVARYAAYGCALRTLPDCSTVEL